MAAFDGSEAGSIQRRQLLGGVGAVVGTALTGCLGTGSAPPDPVTLTEEDRCDKCGMVIPHHPGPNAEIFYADNQPSDHENPARFCSSWEAFQYDFERLDRGWSRQAFYATDYSDVDYEVRTEAGDRYISSHPNAEAFVDGTAVTFVAGSSVLGAMGADLIGFTAEADATAFADEYGGDVIAFGDVTPSVIGQLAQG
jgi:copper chaperone NosL